MLAGGKSERFGEDKAFAKLAGKSLLLHVVERAVDVADEVVVAIGRDAHLHSYTRILPESVRVLKDSLPHKSPLVGMVTGFRRMKSDHSLVLSCDTPFASTRVLEYLFDKATGKDAAIPQWPNGDIEPLQSVYRVNAALHSANLALRLKDSRILDMILMLKDVVFVKIDEIRLLDCDLTTFFNVNTRDELQKAEMLYLSRH